MGRFVYWMNVSVDLFIESEVGEDGGGGWMRIGEELHREFNDRARGLEIMVQGRKVFEIMERSWPVIAEDETMADYLRDYGRIWTAAPKWLVSRERTEAGYNTKAVGSDGDAIDQLAALRSETAGDIGVGGANLATQLKNRGLLDELLLFVHPVVLGAGRPLFDDLDEPLELDLVETATFEDGVAMHRYAIRDVRTA